MREQMQGGRWILRRTALLSLTLAFLLYGTSERSSEGQAWREDAVRILGPRWEAVRFVGPLSDTALEEVITSCKTDPSLYVVFLPHDEPPGPLGRPPCDSTERAYERLLASGLRQQTPTVGATCASSSAPEAVLVRRVGVPRAPDVPLEVERVLQQFLTAWLLRDESGERFLSPRLRLIYSPDTLRDVLVGTSNPHHAGFLINEIASTRAAGWRASVSLFEHYTRYDLDLDLWSNECWLDVIRDGMEYFVDSPFIIEEGHWQLAAVGGSWDISRIRTRCWDVWRDELTLSLGGIVRYRTTSYVLLPPRFADVTGDGSEEILVDGGEGGNYAGSGMLLILHLTGSSVIQLWPLSGGSGLKSERASIRDLDGVGPPELVAGDFRAAYWGPFGHLSTSQQVSVPVIYRWDGSRYVQASSLFPQAYEERLGTIERTGREDVAQWVARHGFEGAVMGLALLAELALTAKQLDRLEWGWSQVRQLAADWRLERLWEDTRGGLWDEPLARVLERFRDELLDTSG